MNKYGFIKIAAAVPECVVGDVNKNCSEIIKLIKESNDNKAQAVLFPELCITSYTCGDLFYSSTLLNGAVNGLLSIADSTRDLDIISIVGLPLFVGVNLFNCAAVIQGGKFLGIVPKTYIPNTSEFYEKRWFYSAIDAKADEIIINGEAIPFGTNIIFDNGDMKFAIEICEDLWVSTPPSSLHTLNGANVIFNLSASNSVIGKKSYRTMLVKQRSFSSHCAYIFTSAGMGESTTDTLYSGHCLIAENGTILIDDNAKTFENSLFYTEIDIERINADRKKISTFHTHISSDLKYKYISVKPNNIILDKLSRRVAPFPFVPGTSKNKHERFEEICLILANSLAKRLIHTKIKNPVIGISGGLDSTLALLIVVKAIDILKIPRKNIIAVTMPGFGTTNRTLENAKQLMKLLGTEIMEISIRDACIQHFKDINHDIENTNVTYENSQARERTQILMDIANQKNGLVIGTGDLSELALGWATYSGDHISMYGINSGVPKTLVRHLVSYIAETINDEEIVKIIYDVLDTPVSPELLPADEDGKISQKTEEILGDYILHDFFLYYFLRFGFDKEKILFLAKTAFENEYEENVIKNCLNTFFCRFFNHQFKRSCMPDGPKIGSITLSPRADFKMPSDASVNLWLE